MRFSEGLPMQGARLGFGLDEAGPGGGASRIIAAERLPRFVPFAMDRLEHGAGRGVREPHDEAVRPAQEPIDPIAARFFARFDEEARQPPRGPSEQDRQKQEAGQAQHDAGYRAGREAALAEGFEQGFAAGLEQAARDARESEQRAGLGLAQRIESLSGALGTRFAQLESQAADDIVAFALEVARQALRSSLALRPEAIVDVVKEALSSLLDERARTRIHLHPADAELVRSAFADRSGATDFEIVADESVERGGCRVETPLAEVDARLGTRWRRTLAAIGRSADGALADSSPQTNDNETGEHAAAQS